MKSVFDKLNLRPQERRLVVIVGIVVFVVMNFVFVFPNFGALGRIQQRTSDTRKKLDLYNSEIARQSYYRKEIETLQRQGMFVVDEQRALTLANDVYAQAGISGVNVPTMTPMQRGSTTGKTNAFFEEQSVRLSINSGEKELIDFLYRLADKEFLIRARSMDVSPDISRMRLQGSITLVKSFQRKPPSKAALTGPVSAAPRPAVSVSNAPARTNASVEKPKLASTAPKTSNVASNAPSPRVTNSATRTPGGSIPFSPSNTNRVRRLPPTPVK
jgi:hypothetical protein